MKFSMFSNGRRIAGRFDGFPLVLLHGFCEDASVWEGLIPQMRNLPVICPDLPGFGGSDVPLAADMGAYAEALLAVLNEFSVEKCVLVGHSMGGYAALEFAEKHPERLAGLGLFHSHPFEDSPERKEVRRRGVEMVESGKRDLYVSQLFPGLFAEAFLKTSPQVVEALISNGKKQSPEGIAAALKSMMARKNHVATLRSIACPMLFLLGSEDAIVSPEQGLQAAVLPSVADVQILEGAGHMGMFEATEKTAQILRGFWEFCAKR